jgi:hypothetical protein
MNDMTQLQILRHALGIGPDGRGRQTRNSFVTGEGSSDWPAVQRLVERGLMTDHGKRELFGNDHALTVTAAGIERAVNKTPKPKLPASKKRYMDYLDYTAAYGITFGEFLRRRTYKTMV